MQKYFSKASLTLHQYRIVITVSLSFNCIIELLAWHVMKEKDSFIYLKCTFVILALNKQSS